MEKQVRKERLGTESCKPLCDGQIDIYKIGNGAARVYVCQKDNPDCPVVKMLAKVESLSLKVAGVTGICCEALTRDGLRDAIDKMNA